MHQISYYFEDRIILCFLLYLIHKDGIGIQFFLWWSQSMFQSCNQMVRQCLGVCLGFLKHFCHQKWCRMSKEYPWKQNVSLSIFNCMTELGSFSRLTIGLWSQKKRRKTAYRGNVCCFHKHTLLQVIISQFGNKALLVGVKCIKWVWSI